ncbi:tRNA (adenine(22)-N(1))-methyltransferase [Brochothrix campestris]|uniref:Putative SAM-dependent methyltransferase n=1 Tax=Brochothrix campestris FSL F6-1037 TaxID=1265861 RepID=W7CR81_9LIST|nr:tRNA (adenine(22)-N(1))-methyltransferase TrmK [Brochothrix campestris]EUJ38231.1 putative SAM-dependent methyltransferase [Brochothrix campestris FSL F6-1037]
MNERALSVRLKTVVDYFPAEAHIADIGSDHAYLPCYAILTNKALSAIAGEVVEGPYQSALQHVQSLALSDKISVRKGNGLAVLQADDAVNTIAIAGMGGPLIRTILEEGQAKLTDTMRLVLQPNIAAHAIREWAQVNDYCIIAETILEEEGKIYEVLVLEKSFTPINYTPQQLRFGPHLMVEKTAVFKKYWLAEQAKLATIIERIEQANVKAANTAKIAQLQAAIAEINEVI